MTESPSFIACKITKWGQLQLLFMFLSRKRFWFLTSQVMQSRTFSSAFGWTPEINQRRKVKTLHVFQILRWKILLRFAMELRIEGAQRFFSLISFCWNSCSYVEEGRMELSCVAARKCFEIHSDGNVCRNWKEILYCFLHFLVLDSKIWYETKWRGQRLEVMPKYMKGLEYFRETILVFFSRVWWRKWKISL